LSKKESKEYEESKEFQEGEQELGRPKNLSLNSFFAHAIAKEEWPQKGTKSAKKVGRKARRA
jgi:hypothetical protein